MHALQAQEQRRFMRQEGIVDAMYLAKWKNNIGGKSNNREPFPPYPCCKKTNHEAKKCWWRHDVKCYMCGQVGHMGKICNSTIRKYAFYISYL